MINFHRIRTDVMALGLLALTLFVGLSLVGYDPADPPARTVWPARTDVANLCGNLGANLSHLLRNGVGLGAYFILLWMVALDVRLFSCDESGDAISRIVGGSLALIGLCVGLSLLVPGLGSGPIIGSGGYVGVWGLSLLEEHFSMFGMLILAATTLTAGMLLSGEARFFGQTFIVATWPVRMAVRPLRRRQHEEVDADDDEIDDNNDNDELLAEDADAEDPIDDVDAPRKKLKINPPVSANQSDRDKIMSRLDASALESGDGGYELPSLDLLEEAEEFPYELLAKKAEIAAEILEKAFHEFGLNVRVVEVDTGPVITQFELELEKGLRLSKVTALADDLAIALRVPAVRVVAPIPGKNTVGVEVPNDTQVMVRLRELIEACPEELEKHSIPIFLGKDVSGRPLVEDLTRMPHLLIAGRTGTGKSVCLNTLILSMLMTRTPDQVRMLMIDPKMVELSPYKRIPHLMHPVITDMKKAEAVLAWAVDKMEERYDLLARCGVRHLDGYNKLGKEAVLDRMGIDADSDEAEQIPEKMPYIVIVADEMADMMMTSGKDVEGHIIRLAQKSRAVGIHLVLATQKPTVDVITGLIKSNLPSRISFQVASRVDSRVVLDEMGAERLLGSGDMLYLAPGTSNLIRAQGAFVGDDETNEVIEFFSDYEPEYSAELAQISTAGTGSGGASEDRVRDALYNDAVEVVIREQIGSVSRLQRFLGIGYGRAARLIDYMAEDGIVGEYNGSKAREVLYKPEEWDALQNERELEPVEA